MRQLNLNYGSISFRIPRGALDYKDNKFVSLINYNADDGAIKILKDIDNGLRVYYEYYLKNARCSLKVSARELDDGKGHKVSLSWSMANKKIVLVVDDKKTAGKIDTSP